MGKEAYISFDQVQNAAFFNERFKISERLGIRDDEILDFRDKMIFLSFLQQGLFKRNVLNSPRNQKEAGCLAILTGYQLIVDLIEIREMKRQEKILSELECATREYIQRYYVSEASHMRARNIELAVNEMVANSTNHLSNFSGEIFNPDPRFLERWGRWYQRIMQ